MQIHICLFEQAFEHKRGEETGTSVSAITMDSLTENIRKEAHWQMMFADDVVLCAREKDVLGLELHGTVE